MIARFNYIKWINIYKLFAVYNLSLFNIISLLYTNIQLFMQKIKCKKSFTDIMILLYCFYKKLQNNNYDKVFNRR